MKNIQSEACARPVTVSYGRPSRVFNGMRVVTYVWCFTFKSVCSISFFFFFSRNKYIDIELPSLICTEFPFSLLALHYPPISPYTHTQTRARARVRSFSFFLPFFFLSTLQLAAPLARLSFYSFRTRALAFTRTHVWSRTHATNDHTTRVPSVYFFFSSFLLHNHHRVKPHSSRPAVAQQPSVANKMLYWQ